VDINTDIMFRCHDLGLMNDKNFDAKIKGDNLLIVSINNSNINLMSWDRFVKDSLKKKRLLSSAGISQVQWKDQSHVLLSYNNHVDEYDLMCGGQSTLYIHPQSVQHFAYNATSDKLFIDDGTGIHQINARTKIILSSRL